MRGMGGGRGKLEPNDGDPYAYAAMQSKERIHKSISTVTPFSFSRSSLAHLLDVSEGGEVRGAVHKRVEGVARGLVPLGGHGGVAQHRVLGLALWGKEAKALVDGWCEVVHWARGVCVVGGERTWR